MPPYPTAEHFDNQNYIKCQKVKMVWKSKQAKN